MLVESKTLKRLWEVPRNSRIRVVYENAEYLFNFSHIDGMYSYCTDDDGKVVHIMATTEVEVL